MKKYNYSDIYLSPNPSELRSRQEANISPIFLGRSWASPVLPANMESVIDIEKAKWLSNNNHFYIMHRFNNSTEKLVEIGNVENWPFISISVGVKQEDKDLLKSFFDKNLRIDCITIDIAHGHSILMKEMIEYIHSIFLGVNNPPAIIAGNVCTPEGVLALVEWGADAVKVGIAGGAACSTKNQTGFHVPMFSCVEECSKLEHPFLPQEIQIIADGGIRENGDFAKALVAGATMVMAGSIFAGCKDAPGENVYSNIKYRTTVLGFPEIIKEKEITYKKYYGSASAKQKGERKNVEGFEVEIPCNGLTYLEKFQEIKEALQSAISYAGGNDLSAFETVNYLSIK